jgi:uncharacterized protein (DUF1697 family)
MLREFTLARGSNLSIKLS